MRFFLWTFLIIGAHIGVVVLCDGFKSSACQGSTRLNIIGVVAAFMATAYYVFRSMDNQPGGIIFRSLTALSVLLFILSWIEL